MVNIKVTLVNLAGSATTFEADGWTAASREITRMVDDGFYFGRSSLRLVVMTDGKRFLHYDVQHDGRFGQNGKLLVSGYVFPRSMQEVFALDVA